MPQRSGTIWWDFDGTLVSRPSMWSRAALTLLDRVAPGHELSFEQVKPHFSGVFPWHRSTYDSSELSTAELWWDHVLETYRIGFEKLNQHVATAPEHLHSIRTDILCADKYQVFPEVVSVLESLQANGWRQVILSNHVPELEGIVVGLGLCHYFDRVITSGAVGFEKPHPRIFETAAQDLRAGETVWMIGDNVRADCEPVGAFGARAILVRNPPGRFHTQAEDLDQAQRIIASSRGGTGSE